MLNWLYILHLYECLVSYYATYCFGLCSSSTFLAIFAILSSHPVLISWSSGKEALQPLHWYMEGNIVRQALDIDIRLVLKLKNILGVPRSFKRANSLSQVILRVACYFKCQMMRQLYSFFFCYEFQNSNNLWNPWNCKDEGEICCQLKS